MDAVVFESQFICCRLKSRNLTSIMAPCWSLLSGIIFVVFINHISTVYCQNDINNDNNETIGHFMVIINNHLSFILCSTTQNDHDKGELVLVNLNDAITNDICIKSSRFDLSQNDLLFEQNRQKLIKINKRKSHSLGIYYLFMFIYCQRTISW